MKTTINKTIWLLFIAATLASCSKDDDINPEPQVNSCEIIKVSGTIDQPTVWKEGFVYVINGSDLRVRSTLTIEPGVIVKLKDARIEVADGKILAQGTAEKRIVFTSLADDRYCGDTNGDVTATKPEKGDWVQISLANSNGSKFQYVDIFYAGKSSGGNTKAFSTSTSSASFTFDYCTIAHTLYLPGSDSYAFYGGAAMKDASVSKFTNNALYDNGKPIYFYGFYQLDPSNIFHNPKDPTQTNSHNGIYLNLLSSNGSGLSVDWNNVEVPYVYENVSVVQIHPTATINIKPNVVVKFSDPTGGLQSYNGNVHLDPTAILTSYKDDAHGGDTNGDGNTTTPSNGDWKGFRFTNGGTGAYWITGRNIRYASN